MPDIFGDASCYDGSVMSDETGKGECNQEAPQSYGLYAAPLSRRMLPKLLKKETKLYIGLTPDAARVVLSSTEDAHELNKLEWTDKHRLLSAHATAGLQPSLPLTEPAGPPYVDGPHLSGEQWQDAF
jgi:hypothetical protein